MMHGNDVLHLSLLSFVIPLNPMAQWFLALQFKARLKKVPGQRQILPAKKCCFPNVFFSPDYKTYYSEITTGSEDRLTPISSNQIFGQIDRRSFGQCANWTPDSLQFLLRNPFIKNTDFGQTWNMALSEDSESHST